MNANAAGEEGRFRWRAELSRVIARFAFKNVNAGQGAMRLFCLFPF